MTDDHHSRAADEVREHDLGLQHDLSTLERRGFTRGMGRRGVLGVLGGLGVAAVAGCASDGSASSDRRPLPGATENYLRGVRESDADGWVEFTTIFPGYSLQMATMLGSVGSGLTATLNVPI